MSERLFFALVPGEAERAAIRTALKRAGDPGGRPMPPDNWHLTLRFLGDVAAERRACLERLARRVRVPPFDFTLEQLGSWRGPGVAWLAPAVVPAGLTALNAACEAVALACGLAADDRPYRPHVTVARKAPPRETGELPQPVPWRAEAFSLMASRREPAGAVYREVARWPLMAGE
ncbi:MAG: RNA 2',3'-cyclic phosphodiesterase [Thiohalospira sp.]